MPVKKIRANRIRNPYGRIRYQVSSHASGSSRSSSADPSSGGVGHRLNTPSSRVTTANANTIFQAGDDLHDWALAPRKAPPPARLAPPPHPALALRGRGAD